MTQIRLCIGNYSGDVQTHLDYISDSNVYDVFTDSFMSEFTKASNFTEFCEMIGCDIASQSDLPALIRLFKVIPNLHHGKIWSRLHINDFLIKSNIVQGIIFRALLP